MPKYKLGKKRKRTSLELLMEDPLLNQETESKLNKHSSSYLDKKENSSLYNHPNHSRCRQSDSCNDSIYIINLLHDYLVSNTVSRAQYPDYYFGSLLDHSQCSSSVKNKEQLSVDEKKILDKIFNSNNLFKTYQSQLTSSEIKSTFLINHFRNMNHLNEVGNFIQLTSKQNITELAIDQSQCFKDIISNRQIDFNDRHCTSEQIKKPVIFYIQKIYDRIKYALHEEKFKLKASKPNWRYQIDLEKIKEKVYRKFLLMVNSSEKNNNNHYDLYYNSNDTFCFIHVVKTALEGLKNGLLQPISMLNRKSKNRRTHYYVFSPEAKAFCIDLLLKEDLPIDIVSKLCDIPPKSLKRWLAVGCLRKKGCGRKIQDPLMEKKLIEWYNNCIKANQHPSPKKIRLKALELTEKKSFLASKGWLEKFKRKLKTK